MPFTPGLWGHCTKPTTFVLCVDDFGVKYFSTADAHHLISVITSNYELTTDWPGSLYCGLTLDWHYDKGYVDVSMPGYVGRALKKFNHPAPLRKQHAPHRWVESAYGSKQPQTPTAESTAQPLDASGTTRVQAINGTFMYYGRGVDPCILVALNEIASEQAKPTTTTIGKTTMLMDYLHTNPDDVIRFYASDMILKITTDAAYLVQPKARSRVAAHYHLGWLNSDRANGPLDVLSKTLKMLSPLQPMLKPATSTQAANMPAPSLRTSTNSATSNQPPAPSLKPTTTTPKVCSTPKCAQNTPNPSENTFTLVCL
jgi:hypothetical protein